MRGKQFINRDLNKQVIDQKVKDSKSVEIDGHSRFCGKRFMLKTKLYGDKRCVYCGKWFHWKDTDYFKWLNESNIDHDNVDSQIEPLHCGSDHCSDYHHEWQKELVRRKRIVKEGDAWRLFKELKEKRVVK